MSLLDTVIGALASQGRGGNATDAAGGGNTQAALLQAVIGMLMQGGQQGSQPGGRQMGAQAGGGLGGLLGGVLGGMAQMGGGAASGAGSSGGGLAGGLGGLLEQFSRAGLGDAAKSWVGTGPNQSVSADQISQVFGGDAIGNLARQLGMAPTEVSGHLSELLPDVVDRLTPRGQVPQGNELSSLGNIDSVLNSLLRR